MLDKAERTRRASARWAVRYALRTGRLVKGPCEFAGASCKGPIEAHHDDHSIQLAVRWVCRKHHRPLDGHMMSREQAPKSQRSRNARGKRMTAQVETPPATSSRVA